MNPTQHVHTLDGLPDEALETIYRRLPYIQSLLLQFRALDPTPLFVSGNSRRSHYGEWLLALEQMIGRNTWIRAYLLPVAEQFGLRRSVEETFVRQCWKSHLFDVVVGRQRVHPKLEDVLPKVLDVFSVSPYKYYWEEKLQEMCNDQWSVETVISSYQQVNEHLAALTRGIVLAYLEYGEIGLLRSSSHLYADDILLLEQHVPQIIQVSSQPTHTVAVLRADITAWHKTLHEIDPSLCQQHILTDPPASLERQHYQQRLKPHMRNRIIEDLKKQRQCDQQEASMLFNTLLDAGLPALIDWRCTQLLQQPATTYNRQRIFSILRKQIAALHPEAQQEVEQTLGHLMGVIEETKTPFPLLRLLRDHPSSFGRRRASRRFSFGYAATVRRRTRLSRKRIKLSNRNSTEGTNQEAVVPGEEALIVAFAKRAGFSIRKARLCLRDFITYGPLGLLTEEKRRAVLERELFWYIELIRFGRVNGTVRWDLLLERVNVQALHLDVPAIPLSVLKVVYRGLDKPAYWHGGQGEAVDTVRQRPTTVIDAPRLHQSWLLVPAKIPLLLTDSFGQPLSSTGHLLLVLDTSTERPMNVWVSSHQPGSDEIRLALYQSIWLPGALDWPLHGIPDAIQIPRSLAHYDRADLERSMWLLMTDIGIVSERRWRRYEVVAHLLDEAVDQIRHVLGAKLPTCEHVQRAILKILKDKWFKSHRSEPVPSKYSERGFAMPGHMTPAAGWLLPVTGEVQTVPNGAVHGLASYTSPTFILPPGLTLKKREFPYSYRGMEQGLFVQYESESQPRLTYVMRTKQSIGEGDE